MELNDLFRDFQYDDLQWVVPVLAGLVIIVGALLAGIIRGMSAGVIIAIFFGGLMAMAPTLVTLVQPRDDRLSEVTAATLDVVGEVTLSQRQVERDLALAISTLRQAIEELEPVVTAAAQETDELSFNQFSQKVEDAQAIVERAIDTGTRIDDREGALRDRLQALQVELRRLDLEARRASQ